MTPEEKIVSTKLQELVRAYERATNTEQRAEILRKAQAIREVTQYDFDHYWRSSSIEEFCNHQAIEKIWGNDFSKEQAVPVLQELCALPPEEFDRTIYLLEKYGQAIEFVFQKPDYLWEAIYEENKSFVVVMEELNDSSEGAISL